MWTDLTDKPFLHVYKPRSKWVGFYRRTKNGEKHNIRIRGECEKRDGHKWGDEKFTKRYNAIHVSIENEETPEKHTTGSLAWLVEYYYDTPQFKALAERTQKDYRKHLDFLKEKFGKRNFANMGPKFLQDLQKEYQHSPRRCNYYIQLFSIIGQLAIRLELRKDNPALGFPKLGGGKGFQPWEDYELYWFEELASRKSIRTAYFLGLFTGQRQGDVLKMEWNQIRGNRMEVCQDKGEQMVWIPIDEILAEELRKTQRRGKYIVCTDEGKKYTSDGFRSNWYKELCEIGLRGLTFHGLRKNASQTLAEAGCSEREIQAITGHETTEMVQHYTKAARRKVLAESAIRKLETKRKENANVANIEKTSG